MKGMAKAYGWLESWLVLLELLAPDGKPDSVPTTSRRWLHATPMFLGFLLLAGIPRLTQPYWKMFREMNLGDVPLATQFVHDWCRFVGAEPWFFTAGMYAIAWSYFTWAGRSTFRMEWFSAVSAVLLVGGCLFLAMALCCPFVVIMTFVGS